MKIMTIINNSHRVSVSNQVNGLVEFFNKRGLKLTSEFGSGFKEDVIDIYLEDVEKNDKTIRLLEYYIANILYDILIEEFIEKKLNKYLSDAYGFLNYSDIGKVKSMIVQILKEESRIDDTVIYCMNRKNRVVQKIIECVEEGNSINVKGFLDFRYKELRIDIYRCVEKIIEKYMVEKEYNEFISLLKYFVEVQESKSERIDMFVGDGEGDYILKDENDNDMMETLISELCENKSIVEISKEDLVISGLITLCPKKVVIHCSGKDKDKELINTIEKVFEGRVEYCTGCKKCSKLKEFIQIPVDSNIKV